MSATHSADPLRGIPLEALRGFEAHRDLESRATTGASILKP